MKNYTEILKTCISIAEDRQKHYGEASKSLEKCSDILKDVFNIDLNVEEICKVLIALKLSRLNYKFKEDSYMDIINYIAIMINDKKQN